LDHRTGVQPRRLDAAVAPCGMANGKFQLANVQKAE
jgi:hypothetical protein